MDLNRTYYNSKTKKYSSIPWWQLKIPTPMRVFGVHIVILKPDNELRTATMLEF